MTPEEAGRALRPLVIATEGWTQEAIVFYVEKLGELNDPVALTEACEQVAGAWKAGRRPPLAEITDAYRIKAKRRALRTPQLEAAEAARATLHDGRLIASQEYAAECVRQGREPNWHTFERVLRGVPG